MERINDFLKNYPGIEVKEADNAVKARELLKTDPFDMVITEVYIKGVSALELNHLAREKNPDCCVIIITSIDSADIAQKAVKEGAFDFIIRPAQMDKLENLVKLYLSVK